MRSFTFLTLATLIAAAPPVVAQELTVRERVYAGTLGTAFNQKVVDARPVTRPDGGVGVAVTLADGTTLTRLRYPDPAGAIAQVGHFDGGDSPTVLQARGRQALIVQGPGMSDPVVARHALATGWSYLRGGKAPVAVTGYTQGTDIVTHTAGAGLVYDEIGDAVAAAQRGGVRAGVQDLGGGLYRWDSSSSGTHAVFQQDSRGGSFLLSDDPAQARRLADYMETLTGRDLPFERGLDAAPGAKPIAKPITKPITKPIRKPIRKPVRKPVPEPIDGAAIASPKTPKPPAQGAYEGASKKLDNLFGD